VQPSGKKAAVLAESQLAKPARVMGLLPKNFAIAVVVAWLAVLNILCNDYF
jgi:hypothetical protein